MSSRSKFIRRSTSRLRAGLPRLILAATAAVLLLQAGCTREAAWSTVSHGIESSFPQVRRITTDSLAARLAADSLARLVLLDVRTPEEYAVSHLDGAMRVDPDGPLPAALDTLDRETPVVTYCSVGYRSASFAVRLKEAGFTDVANLEGSIFRWANEGRPVYRAGQPVREVHPYDAVWGRLLDHELRASKTQVE